MNVQSYVKRVPGTKLLFALSSLFYADVRSGRLRTLIFIFLGNVLPDLLIFAHIRPFLWRLAGAKIVRPFSCAIRKGAFIEYAWQLRAGSHFQVGRDTYFCAHAPITVGNNVTLSIDCKILTMHHEGLHHEVDIFKPITIADGVIIYAGAILLPGSIINTGTIVSAGAVFRGESEANAIYSGNPAKIVNTVGSHVA